MTEYRASDFVPCGCTPPCDATEPHDGWEAWITNIVTAALLSPAADVQINTCEEAETGRALSVRFTGRLDVREFLRQPYLSERQIKVLVLMLGLHVPGSKVGCRLGVDTSTVYRDRHDGLEALARLLSGNPLLKMEWRNYRREIGRTR